MSKIEEISENINEIILPKNVLLSVQIFDEDQSQTKETNERDIYTEEPQNSEFWMTKSRSPSYIIGKKINISDNKRWILYAINDWEIEKEVAKSDNPIKLYEKIYGKRV